MRKQFRDTVTDLAAKDEKIVLLFGDISVYLFNDFKLKYPERFYNLGICENTIVSVAAGLSARGFYPFVHSITPFITERSYEQLKLDMSYNKFGGNILSCGASFDYAWDGATHHCYTDLAILRLLPEAEVIQPGSKKELDTLIRSQYNNGKLTYFRLSDYPHQIDLEVQFGKGVILKNTDSALTVMTAGPILANVVEACRDLNVNLIYFNTIKPIDKELINKFKKTEIVVIHDAFGLYEAVCEVPGISASSYGLADQFYAYYGTVNEIRQKSGLDPQSIKDALTRKYSKIKVDKA